MNRRKLNTDQADALKKAALRRGRISDIRPQKKSPDGAERHEFARAREMERKIEEFFTAPRNFDFSIDSKKEKRWRKGKISKEAKTWHSPVSSRYKAVRHTFISEKYRKLTITVVSVLTIVVLLWLLAALDGVLEQNIS